MNCTITGCICTTRRNPAALPPSAHRPVQRLVRDADYRKALGVEVIPASVGRIAHTRSRIRRARRPLIAR